MVADPLGRRVPNKFPIWVGTQVRSEGALNGATQLIGAREASRVHPSQSAAQLPCPRCCPGYSTSLRWRGHAGACVSLEGADLRQALHQRCAPLPPSTPLCLYPQTQFLTNVFLPIYLALRLRPDPPAASADDASSGSGSAAAPAQAPPTALPSYAPIFGGVALAVGAVSVWWALEARPEAGDLAARWAYFSGLLASSRVDWAFGVDASLYAVWQAWLLGAAGAAPLYRFVPFFGMAAWLLRGSEQPDEPAA